MGVRDVLRRLLESLEFGDGRVLVLEPNLRAIGTRIDAISSTTIMSSMSAAPSLLVKKKEMNSPHVARAAKMEEKESRKN